MAKYTNAAFDVDDKHFRKGGRWKDRQEFTNWLCNELDLAQSARRGVESEIKNCWDYYEQARMRGSNMPWPDAADLPSPYAPEYVDAVHARLMQTVFVDPVWTVEGWGASAARAPFVEEFHQRAQEDERLQNYMDEWVLRGLVEGVGTIEVTEAIELRRERVKKRVALQLDEMTGAPVIGEDGQPMLAADPETGNIVEADPNGPEIPSAEIEADELQPVRLGPEYDVVPYMDFMVLPAHARNAKQVWGYSKRFWRRITQLEGSARRGIYDQEAVEGIGSDNDRANLTDEAPQGAQVVSQDGPTAQKELYEVQLLADCDGKGERWYRVTVHKDRKKLLRMKYDDRTTRYLRWYPFPKPGSVDRGYSLVGNKLIVVLEEDTARRNLTADRMALVASQPVKRLHTALWDPFEQPFGPKAVIDVRDMREVEPFTNMPDVPASVMAWRQHIRDDADRLVGQNDVSLGAGAAEDQSKPTATQVAATSSAMEVRINVITQRMREPMEELALARHTIWVNTLRTNTMMPPMRALAMSQRQQQVLGTPANGIYAQGVGNDQQVTADMLEGIFWFKPKGSVESANLVQQRNNFIGFLQTLPAVIQTNPAIAQIFMTMPAAKAMVEQMLRVFQWQDRQSFLGSEAQNVFDVMAQQQQMQQDPRMQLLMAVAGAGGMGGGQPAPGAGVPAPEGAGGPPPNGPVM